MSAGLCGVTSRSHTIRLRAVAVLLVLGTPLLSGCSGSARVHTITLGSKRISTTSPLIIRIDPDECYWWINDKGRLCIAMRKANWSPLSKLLEREFLLSFVLDDPPAGPARNYRADRRTLRSRRRAGYSHTRAASLGGIVTVWDYGGETLKGRFRITAVRQSYLVLTGWRAGVRVLVIGEFTAVHNRGKGEAILARTEEDKMVRPPARTKPPSVQVQPQDAQTGKSEPTSTKRNGQ